MSPLTGAEDANTKPSSLVPVLQAIGLTAGFGSIPHVRDVDLAVHPGEMLALLGANGAGKTTTIMSLAGQLRRAGGEVLFKGAPAHSSPERRARAGLGLVTQERCVFMGLSLSDNLRLGRGPVEEVLALFPELRVHLRRPVGLLSGGQQQMLAVGRALAARPSVLLADELSFGLGPLIVDRLLVALRRYADEYGIAVILVEQHIQKALKFSDRAVVLQHGRVALQGSAADLRGRPEQIQQAYLAG